MQSTNFDTKPNEDTFDVERVASNAWQNLKEQGDVLKGRIDVAISKFAYVNVQVHLIRNISLKLDNQYKEINTGFYLLEQHLEARDLDQPSPLSATLALQGPDFFVAPTYRADLSEKSRYLDRAEQLVLELSCKMDSFLFDLTVRQYEFQWKDKC